MVIDRHHSVIDIYRYENQETWTLEVVDPDGTSHLWEQKFSNDEIALETAFREIGTAGAEVFMRRDNVILFRKSQPSRNERPAPQQTAGRVLSQGKSAWSAAGQLTMQ